MVQTIIIRRIVPHNKNTHKKMVNTFVNKKNNVTFAETQWNDRLIVIFLTDKRLRTNPG